MGFLTLRGFKGVTQKEKKNPCKLCYVFFSRLSLNAFEQHRVVVKMQIYINSLKDGVTKNQKDPETKRIEWRKISDESERFICTRMSLSEYRAYFSLKLIVK